MTKSLGCVYKDKVRGCWTAVLEVEPDVATGRRRRRKMSARTKAEVLVMLDAAKREAAAGVEPTGDKMTVAALLRDYYEDRLATGFRSEKTQRSYEWAIEDHLVPAIGARKVNELSTSDVRGVLNAKRDAGLSQATLTHIHGVLRRAYAWGQDNDIVYPNLKTVPMRVSTPRATKARHQGKALNSKQAGALLRVAAEDRLEALFVLHINTPCRPGELTGLPWSAIDFENGVIEIRQALHHGVDGRLYLGGLKTDESDRRVKVSRTVVEALQRRRRSQRHEKEWCLAHGVPWAEGWAQGRSGGFDPDLVFTTIKGTPLDSNNVRRSLNRLTKRAGIPGSWTTYELRHSIISILSDAGVPIEVISKRAGHRNTRVTESVYRHNLRSVLTEGADVLDRLMAPESAETG
jgi:integrase